MLPLLIDGIIFDLQPVGGISRVWSTLLAEFLRAEAHFEYIEGSSATRNYYRQKLTSLTPIRRENLNARIRKFIPAQMRSKSEHLYIPTYYRQPPARMLSVQVCHDTMREEAAAKHLRPLLTSRRRKLYESATRIICVSHATKNDLLNIYGAHLETKATVIYNPVKLDAFDTVNETESPTVSAGLGPYAIYVGARTGAKNFSETTKLLALFPDLKLVVVGGPFTDAERASINSFETRVMNAGRVSDVQLKQLVSGAAMLFLPSLKEGFGFPVIEAILLGTPVVCRDTPVNREISMNGAYFYCGGRADDLYVAVEAALNSGPVSETLKAKMRSAYDSRAIALKYLRLFDDCAI